MCGLAWRPHQPYPKLPGGVGARELREKREKREAEVAGKSLLTLAKSLELQGLAVGTVVDGRGGRGGGGGGRGGGGQRGGGEGGGGRRRGGERADEEDVGGAWFEVVDADARGGCLDCGVALVPLLLMNVGQRNGGQTLGSQRLGNASTALYMSDKDLCLKSWSSSDSRGEVRKESPLRPYRFSNP